MEPECEPAAFRRWHVVKGLARWNQPEEFTLSRLRCIVGLSFVLISSRGDCHDSRSYGQNGSAIIAAKGCVTKKIVYWRHNGPPGPWRTLAENGPQAFQSIKEEE